MLIHCKIKLKVDLTQDCHSVTVWIHPGPGSCPSLFAIVSEPDPRKIKKEGLVNGMGCKCTLQPVFGHTSDWF